MLLTPSPPRRPFLPLEQSISIWQAGPENWKPPCAEPALVNSFLPVEIHSQH